MHLKEIAQILDQAVVHATPVGQTSQIRKITIEEAYEIQKLVLDRRIDRGERLIGIKLGFASEAKMKQMGVSDMIWGRLTDKMLIQNRGEFYLHESIHPRAEPEVCFRISKDIEGEVALDDLDQYVDGVAAAVEIIDSRYENFKFSLEDVVADNCSASSLVIGEWQPPSQNIGDLKMTLSVNGEVREEGSSTDILGNPWNSLQGATRLAHCYGEKIKAGHVIMSGAATEAIFLEKGTKVKLDVEQLGSCDFLVR